MEAKHISFGTIEVNGERYDHDLVIDAGSVSRRSKKPSKPYKKQFGHTPLSIEEEIPWNGSLIIGTGASGRLPVMERVYHEAERRGVKLTEVRTDKACRVVSDMEDQDVHAILHSTC